MPLDAAPVTLGYGVGLGCFIWIFLIISFIVACCGRKPKKKSQFFYKVGAAVLCVVSIALFLGVAILGGQLQKDVDNILVRT